MGFEFKMEVRGSDLARKFGRMAKDIPKIITRGLDEVGAVVAGEARKITPISPTQAQADAAGLSFAKGSAPGELTSSIDHVVRGVEVKVGVFHGPATKYADFIHNGQGTSWKKLGPGSEAKDAKTDGEVGGKFLDRGADNTDITGIMDNAIGKGLEKGDLD